MPSGNLDRRTQAFVTTASWDRWAAESTVAAAAVAAAAAAAAVAEEEVKTASNTSIFPHNDMTSKIPQENRCLIAPLGPMWTLAPLSLMHHVVLIPPTVIIHCTDMLENIWARLRDSRPRACLIHAI